MSSTSRFNGTAPSPCGFVWFAGDVELSSREGWWSCRFSAWFKRVSTAVVVFNRRGRGTLFGVNAIHARSLSYSLDLRKK